MSGDKSFIYDEQIIRSFDWQHMIRDLHKSMARLAYSFTGSGLAFVTGAGATEQTVPSLTINIAEGWIHQMAALDATQWGTLAADTSQVLRQGWKAAHTLTLNGGALSSGQSQWVLVQAKFTPVDEIREGDPDAGVYGYWNSENPLEPLNGPNDSGDSQPSVRRGTMETMLRYGTPASTGSQVPPTPDTGWVPLYLILLTNGQTTITTAQILIAGPSVGIGVPSDYPRAPFNSGLYGHHHTGGGGSAPKIDLPTEVSGILPYSNMPVSNPSPPVNSKIPVFASGSTAPQGNRAGEVDDYFYHTTSKVLYRCATAGNAGAAVWEAVAIPETVVSTASTLSLSGRIHKVYLLRPTEDFIMSLAAADLMLGSIITVKNDLDAAATYKVVIDPNGSELINGQLTLTLYPGQSVTFVPRVVSGVNSWTILSGPIGQAFGGNGGRQCPTSGALSGTYLHEGNWTSTGPITFAPGTKIKIQGGLFKLDHTMTGDTGFIGGFGSDIAAQAPEQGTGISPGRAVFADRCGGGGGGNGGRGGAGGSSTTGNFAMGGPAVSIDEYFGGSSGGGGATTGTDAAGDGGAAGGSIYIECAGDMDINQLIKVNGGDGTNGTANNGGGGGAGSGGTAELRAGGSVDLTGGGIEAKGGNAGDGGGNSGGHGGKGGAGGGGNVRIWAGGTVTGGANVNISAGASASTGSSSQDSVDAANGVYIEITNSRPSSRF